MADTQILVLGGTGKIGRRVASLLEHRKIPARPASRTGRFRFDWRDENTWAPALTGTNAVYLVDSQDDAAAALMGPFSQMAVASGVRKLVLLSARDWSVSGGDAFLATERAVKDSGGEWTILRPTWFAHNFSESPFLLNPVLSGEVVLSTGDGLEPFIDANDIAQVATATLTEDGHAGQTYELSGPALLSFRTVVDTIGKLTDRQITYVSASPEQYKAHAVSHGIPVGFAEALTMLFGWISDGRNAHLSDGVQRVLHREPRDVTDYLKAAAATGVWNP